MKLIVTGGGTGGHIYPALEVGRLAALDGAELLYLGSRRGQEAKICGDRGIEFIGFPSEPLWSLATPKGWRAMIQLTRATLMAKRAVRKAHPDVIFSTGGYSAAPVMAAARSLGIPFVIHESNSVPGRSNRLFAGSASGMTCVFRHTLKRWPGAVRTGQPIREELRLAARDLDPNRKGVIVVGGSQGSDFLNKTVPIAAQSLDKVPFVHSTGPKLYDAVATLTRFYTSYKLRPYLDASDLIETYQNSTLAVARSGGTLAEFALFRIPSILIPLPLSADQHQLRNAQEFAEMGAAEVLPQSAAKPERLAASISAWLKDPERIAKAQAALAEWDTPNATSDILRIVQDAAKKAR